MYCNKYFLHPSELYKLENTGEHYSEWLFKKWDYSIKLALKLGMQIIPLRVLSKRPLFPWTDVKLSYEAAMYFALRGNNLAAVCNHWYLLDLDRPDEQAYFSVLKELKELKNGGHILTANTARGFHIWLDWQPRNLQEICKRYELDVPRHSIMYALIPFSITCTYQGCRDDPNIPKHKHQYVIRRWLDVI